MNTLHLTEEQLDDILLGDANRDAISHYENCAECHARADEMSSAIRSFTAVTMEWSERRSATLPPQPVTDGSIWGQKLNWALGAGVLAVAVILLPLVTSNSPGGSKAATADAAQASTPYQGETVSATQAKVHAIPAASTATMRLASTSQVERDNRMLQAISEELDASIASPTETFGVEAPQGGGHMTRQVIQPAIWD